MVSQSNHHPSTVLGMTLSLSKGQGMMIRDGSDGSVLLAST
jgi:hypothetical protein